ncbi:MAG TPA: hypothetical protein V6C96_03265 [Vampirovibrionales bacterium]
MSTEVSSGISKIVSSALIAIAILGSVCLLKSDFKNKDQYTFQQLSPMPIFLRFNKSNGTICYTAIGDGKFLTDSWRCLDGSKVQEAEVMKAEEIKKQLPSNTEKEAAK